MCDTKRVVVLILEDLVDVSMLDLVLVLKDL